MSKKVNISDRVMSRIRKEGIGMRPAWYFVLGSVLLLVGVVLLSVISVFTVSLAVFSLRSHGPMGQVRVAQLLSSFPWWTIPVAAVGLGMGLWLLRRYDFSYRHSFIALALGFILAVVLTGFALDFLGLDRLWSGRGPFRGLYQRYSGTHIQQRRGFGPPSAGPFHGSD